jgi:hypothetical protein
LKLKKKKNAFPPKKKMHFPFVTILSPFLPVELQVYTDKIIKQDELYKVREKLRNDGIFERHVQIQKMLPLNYCRVPWDPEHPDCFLSVVSCNGYFLHAQNSTILKFEKDFLEDIGYTFDLKSIREELNV